MEGLMGGRTDERPFGWMEGGTDRVKDGWADGWIDKVVKDGLTNLRTDGRME